MSDDYTKKLREIFSAEAGEWLQQLDENFAVLDQKDLVDDLYPPVIAEIFRVIHSFKASVATIGHPKMAKMMHTLEEFLEKLRDKKIPVDRKAIDVLFTTTATVKEDVSRIIEKDEDLSDARLLEVETIVRNFLQGGVAPAAKVVEKKLRVELNDEYFRYYQLIIRPNPSCMKEGFDPQKLFDELKLYGELETVIPSTQGLPDLDSLNPREIYLSWEIQYKSSLVEEEIRAKVENYQGKIELLINDISSRFDNGIDKTIAEKRIGDILIERGQASEKDILTVAAKQTRMGEILIAEKKADAKDVQKALKDQTDAKKNTPQSVRVDIKKLDSLVNLVGELVINQSRIKNLADQVENTNLKRILSSKCEETFRIINDLQGQIMTSRMVPIDTVFTQFHRTVRDLALKQGKSIRLVITGQETEIDKNVIEKINNPLKHLVRNGIDHGIETPEVRSAAGKSKEALLSLKAYHREGSFFIEISDDGKGLDRDAILTKAVERGLIFAHETPSNDHIYSMIFQPGFSTAKVVTDVSGRGVGMDVVKRAINELRGKIEIKTEMGKGTTFIIRLPLTMAIIDGLLFTVGKRVYIIPLLSVEETYQPKIGELNSIEERGEFLSVRGAVCPLIRMHKIFEVEGAETDVTKGMILNVTIDHRRYSLLVDEILGQQQVVLKSLEDNFNKVKGLSGATILGDGSVATIIEPEEIVELYKSYSEKNVKTKERRRDA